MLPYLFEQYSYFLKHPRCIAFQLIGFRVVAFIVQHSAIIN